MARIIDLLNSEYSTEYFKLNYTIPKIYPKKVLSKPIGEFTVAEKKELLKVRWYVYYSFQNPVTNKMERQPPIYYNVNRKFSIFEDRLKHIMLIRENVEKLLKRGFSEELNSLLYSR